MSTWYKLPAEIKQIILEYLVSDLHVKFTRKFLTRRLASKTLQQNCKNKKDNENTITKSDVSLDTLSSLLLVDKKFISYQEMETALLHGATIMLEQKTSSKLYELEKRYASDGLGLVKSLGAARNVDDWRHSCGDLFPRGTDLKKLKGLRRFTLFLKSAFDIYFTDGTKYKLNELILAAEGYQGYQACRHHLKAMLQCYLRRRVGDRMHREILRWLVEDTGVSLGRDLERIIVWETDIGNTEVKTEFRFSTANYCVEFTDGEKVVLCPQRLDSRERFYNDDLAEKVAAIDLDKHFIV